MIGNGEKLKRTPEKKSSLRLEKLWLQRRMVNRDKKVNRKSKTRMYVGVYIVRVSEEHPHHVTCED